LALQRALRPLKRTVPAARARLLDERATADRIARLGAHPDVWLPVLRPARERWLRLALVHDTGPTMPVWRPLVRELHTVLAQSGIFRTVTLHPAGPDGRAGHVPDPADGRTLTLVVSDCMGPQWRPGPAGARWYATLRHWASRMPLAVVQPLPEHLWPTTALPAEPGVLSSPGAAAPPATLAFAPYDPDATRPHPAAFPLPVLEAGAPWLAHWAALVAGPGGAHTPGAAAWLSPAAARAGPGRRSGASARPGPGAAVPRHRLPRGLPPRRAPGPGRPFRSGDAPGAARGGARPAPAASRRGDPQRHAHRGPGPARLVRLPPRSRRTAPAHPPPHRARSHP
ncbi:SAV_2336 N-terminal domain-related protein, partial [Streptomyces phaeoluteigriseus]|uniref:SAV_2336 N-terminal domain-related protein n=1 Tax=Streptomyces phaeoluteigriseus TaxID=114686 RepID=UPI002481EAB6